MDGSTSTLPFLHLALITSAVFYEGEAAFYVKINILISREMVR